MTFPTPSPADWKALAEKALKDRPIESLIHLDADHLAVRPLYGSATGVQPLSAPRPSDAEGRAWDLRALVEGDEPAAVNAALLADLEGGAASVVLKGAVLADSAPLTAALDGVALELAAVGLDAGLAGPEAANALAVAAKGSPRAKLMFHMDPLSAFAATGAAPRSVEEHLSLAANTAARHAGAYPEATFFLASGRVVHEAGGSIGQELAFAAANAAALVRAALDAGMTDEQALQGTVLGVAVDQEYFDSLAKVRALRLIWRSLSRAFGSETPAVIEARSSRRMLSARNTQLVLMEEAHIGRVDDPAAGSWFLDQRTRELAEAGWSEFQKIEAEGGLVEALRGHVIQPRVARARQTLEAALAGGVAQMVGVTKFVDADPRPAPVEPDRPDAPQGGGDSCEPLTPMRFAAPFEVKEAGQ